MPASTIQLRDVSLRRESTWLLQHVDLDVGQGVDAAILGPNGSGKSTLARVIMGYLWPSQGSVRVLDEQFGSVDLSWLRTQIKLVQPGGGFDLDPNLTLRQIVLTGFTSTMVLRFEPSPAQLEKADAMLEIAGIARLADRYYRFASTGERVRAQIARALVTKPRLLLLDEPTAGLDILGREQLLDLIASLRERINTPELTIVTITHHTEELFEGTSQVILLDEGRVAASGAIEQVIASETLSRVYKVPIKVHREGGRFFTLIPKR